MYQTNYSDGYILEYHKPCFNSWLLLPAGNLWPLWLRGVLYALAMLYIFLGIAIVADLFMLSIEMITSKKRIIFTFDYERKERVEREVFVWNETIANLTLMALGSSAPEILIAVIETVSSIDETKSTDGLGVFTIIGSASYNLLVITAVCIISVPSPTSKRVNELGVFLVTSVWSMFAYLWLIIVLKWSSPNVIEIWEAVVTLFFFPLLVLTAWAQDKSWWVYKCTGRSSQQNKSDAESCTTQATTLNTIHEEHQHQKHIVDSAYHENSFVDAVTVSPTHKNCVVEGTVTSPRKKISELRLKQFTESPSKLRDVVTFMKESDHTSNNLSAQEVMEGLRDHFESSTMSKAFARARFRHAVVLSITGQHRPQHKLSNFKNLSHAITLNDVSLKQSLELTDMTDQAHGSFSFSSATYTVSKKAKFIEIDVLFHRIRSKRKKVGFSHIVDAAFRAKKLSTHLCESLPSQRQAKDSLRTTRHEPLQESSSLPDVDSASDGAYIERFNNLIHKNKNIAQSESYHSLTSTKSNTVLNGRQPTLNKTMYTVISPKQSLKGAKNSLPEQCKNNIELDECVSYCNESYVDDSIDDIERLENINMVRYETREGSAKHKKDFLEVSGSLIFSGEEYSKRLVVPILSSEDENIKDFYVVLRDASFETSLGDPSIAHVTLVNDNEPGEFIFKEPTYHVQYPNHNGDLAVACSHVVRLRGSDGSATLLYRTINGTAFGGDLSDLKQNKCDFEQVEHGELTFSSGETSKQINIRVNPKSERGKTFIIALYHASGPSKIGHRCAAIISLTSEVDEIVDQVTSLVSKDNRDNCLRKEWKQQFIDAMYVDENASVTSMLLHFLCFLWKVLFAAVPPRKKELHKTLTSKIRTLWGGWATFVVSLLMLGVLSALVEQISPLLFMFCYAQRKGTIQNVDAKVQFAKLLGCVIGLHVSITGITLVALGTSMPDTFASKTAAAMDDSADAAIGNITGSNSVNVFLGLGLPWVIKSIYLHFKKDAQLRLEDNNLLFSVLVFLGCGTITLFILIIRRTFLQGELGGRSLSKYLSGVFLISLWLLFIVLSSLQAYKIITVL